MDADELLQSVMEGGDALSQSDAQALMASLLQGGLSDVQMAGLLTALHQRGETAEEVAGFVRGMRAAATMLPLTDAEREDLVDTCGTGGDGSGTFNISTAVALVAAAAGVRIAKHGNRAVTSKCGSADVLEALGVPVEHTADEAAATLRRDGFCFMLAARMHPAMRIIAPVRRSLPFRTVFNVVGPMTNPAGARRQVMGVYAPELVGLVADALAAGGYVSHALVVHGEGGVDELSLAGESLVAEVRGGVVRRYTVTPGDAGLERSSDALLGGDALVNAAILRRIFAGELGPRRDVVLLNAAAVLMVAGIATDLREGAGIAAAVIDDGRVTRLLARLSGDSSDGIC